MKLLITGSRKYNDYEAFKAVLKEYREHCLLTYKSDITLLLHGGAKGADSLAMKYAREMEIKEKVVSPDYIAHYSKVAPLIRNTELVAQTDAVIAFYHQKQTGGTLDAVQKSIQAGKETWEVLNGKITKHSAKDLLELL